MNDLVEITKNTIEKIKQANKYHKIKGKLVLCVVNFEPKQIGKHISEVLTIGIPDSDDNVSLISPDHNVPLGGRLY